MDPEYIKSLPFKPHDQTSNQLFADIQLAHPSNKELLLETARELKDEGWLAIYTRMVSHHIPPNPKRNMMGRVTNKRSG